MVENLSISRGQTMPRLKIIETPAMNAYASGIRDKNYTVTLTRGLMNNLDDAELRAVIAHELSHIRHKDVRVLIIAVIFVGIFSFFGEIVVRGALRTNYSRSVGQFRRFDIFCYCNNRRILFFGNVGSVFTIAKAGIYG